MTRIIMSLVLYLMLQGCVSSLYMNITPVDLKKIRSIDQINMVFTQTPFMLMQTPSDALVASGLYSWSNGSVLNGGHAIWTSARDHYKFSEPGPVLAKKMFEGLTRKAQISNLKLVEEPFGLYETWGAPDDKIKPEYKDRFKKGYLLEVRPLAYQMNYLLLDGANYAMVFRAQALLVNIENNRVIWRGYCAAGGYENEALRFNWNKMDNIEAMRLKIGIELSGRLCAEQLVGQFQGKDTKP